MFSRVSKKFILSFILIPAIMACSLFTSTPGPSQADIEREEQIVYSFFVGGEQGPALILENTATSISPGDDPEQTREYMKSGLPDLSRETIDNFMERNETPGPLSPDMQLGVEYVLLSEEELANITRQPNWHEILVEKYGSMGYTIFSRVGFNRTLDQAVVYVGDVQGPLMGAGYYYMLEKQNGEWKLTGEIMVWIS